LGTFSLHFLGCNKTNQPFGVYSPNGLDVPSPTPLPLTGAIVVNVSDGTNLVVNLTVQAVPPGNATTLTTITNGNGQAAFNPNPIAPGIWTIQIPQQSNPLSNYGLSQQFVTIGTGSSSANINFSTGTFIANLQPAINNTYPTSLQNNLVYNLSLTQTGTLNVLATYSFVGMPFPYTSSPSILDTLNPAASITFQVPSCTNFEPIFYANLIRTGGTISPTLVSSNSATIIRGYPVTINSLTHSESLACTLVGVNKGVTFNSAESINDVWQITTTGGCTGRPFHVHIDFVSTNDGSTSSPSSEDFILNSNSSFSFNWTPTHSSPVQFIWVVTDNGNSANTWSGNFVWDPHWGSGGSCSCTNQNPSGGFRGCQGTTSITVFNNLVLNP
jgi:hypothetical protein